MSDTGPATSKGMKIPRLTHSSHHAHVATTHAHHIASHAHHVPAHWHVHSTHWGSTHRVHAHVAPTATVAHATTHVTTHHTAAVEVVSKVVHTHGVAKVVHRCLCAIASHVATTRRKIAVILVAHAASVEVSSVVVISAPVVETALIVEVA